MHCTTQNSWQAWPMLSGRSQNGPHRLRLQQPQIRLPQATGRLGPPAATPASSSAEGAPPAPAANRAPSAAAGPREGGCPLPGLGPEEVPCEHMSSHSTPPYYHCLTPPSKGQPQMAVLPLDRLLWLPSKLANVLAPAPAAGGHSKHFPIGLLWGPTCTAVNLSRIKREL